MISNIIDRMIDTVIKTDTKIDIDSSIKIDNTKYYGFSFVKENAGGLGAAIYAIMLAAHYAKSNKLQLGLVEEGYRVPRLNGCINDAGGEDKNWHSYFKSLPIIKEKDAVAVWQVCPNGFTRVPGTGKKIEWYSQILKDIYVLQDDHQNDVNQLVIKSGFNSSTDVVLHIRRTDKVFPNKGSVIESGELPLDVYVNETVKVVKQLEAELTSKIKIRVFLCTDDKEICPEMRDKFTKHDIEMIWDKTESVLHLQSMRMSGELKRSDAWEENLCAFKNLAIMSRGLGLVGGRMSYFFRIAELLRYPLPTKNIKDGEKFGKAQYAEDSECFMNPFREFRYLDFVSSVYLNKTDEEWKSYTDILNKEYIINIPNFMDSKTAEIVFKAIKEHPQKWWNHAIRPNEKGVLVSKKEEDPELATCVKYAEKAADAGLFAYHFQRTSLNHYKTCKCVSCRLRDTMDSYPVMTILSKIIGKTVTGMNETFASKYVRNDFLTIHHDKSKGDYTFILSLSKDWNPVHGGLTHFCDINKNVYKTETPKFNNLIIFKLDPKHQMDHFVSRVCGPNARFAYTGWFKVEE